MTLPPSRHLRCHSPACRTVRLATAALAILAFGLSGAAAAQTYPAKPVRLIVPFAPGGGTDILGRMLCQRLTEALGQPFIVDNRGGAGGVIGAELAAKSPADGYTIAPRQPRPARPSIPRCSRA